MPKPKGATIVKEESDNEAGKKLNQVKRDIGFGEFLANMKKSEEESIKPLSGDQETLTNVSKKDLEQFQKDKRLVGWYPKTKTALVLKEAFLEKKKAKNK